MSTKHRNIRHYVRNDLHGTVTFFIAAECWEHRTAGYQLTGWDELVACSLIEDDHNGMIGKRYTRKMQGVLRRLCPAGVQQCGCHGWVHGVVSRANEERG